MYTRHAVYSPKYNIKKLYNINTINTILECSCDSLLASGCPLCLGLHILQEGTDRSAN